MKPVYKGCFGYLNYKKKTEIVKTIVFFGISLSLYFAGVMTTGSNKNLLTIVAVLGCLPASKSAVSMIMFLKAKECSEESFHRLKNSIGEEGIYDCYFTSYDKNFPVSHLVVKNLSVTAFSENAKIKEAEFEEYIRSMLLRNGISNYNVKLYKDLDKYLKRLQQISAPENEKSRDEEVVRALLAISL